MDAGVCACSANFFSSFLFSFSNSVFSSGELSFFWTHPSQFSSFLSKLSCTDFQAELLLTSLPNRQAGLHRDLPFPGKVLLGH